MMNLNKYRDNNNFIKINHMKAQDERWTFFGSKKFKEFIDHTAKPSWDSESYDWLKNASYDYGQTYQKQNYRMLFGCFFFLSDERVEVYRHA
jgi:hypothetical protein